MQIALSLDWEMQSLRELAFNEVIKIGNWKITRLPHTLLRELHAVDECIERDMTGVGYYDFTKLQSARFNMDWISGCWIFCLYGGPWKTERLGIEILRYNGNHMVSDWSDVFALSGTAARLNGFRVSCYDLEVSNKKVIFYGSYLDYLARTINFRAEFTFNPNENCLDVRTFGWIANRLRFHFECHRRFHGTSQEFWVNTILEEIEEETVRYD